MRVRLTLLGTAVSAVLALGCVAPAEAQRSGRLELSGTRAASIDLVLREEAELLPGDFRMRTKGSYAGIAVLDRTGEVLAVAMNVQPWIAARPSAAEQPVTTVLERTVLYPGRYRLLLLTDGPSTVSLPARGAFVRALRPTTPYDDDVRLVSPPSAGAPGVHRAAVPTDLRDTRFVLMAHHIETTAMRAQLTGMCLAPRGGQVCRPQDLGFTEVRHGGALAGDPGWVRSELSGPTTFEGYDLQREFDVRFDDATVDPAGGKRYGLVVVL